MSEGNGRIEVGACRCPGGIHEEDWVELTPALTLEGGLRVVGILTTPGPDAPKGPAALTALFETEIKEWSFIGPEGDPAPINPTTIRHFLPYALGGAVIANQLVSRLEEATTTDPFKVRTTRRSSGSGRTRAAKRETGPTSTSPTSSS